MKNINYKKNMDSPYFWNKIYFSNSLEKFLNERDHLKRKRA